MVTTLTELTDQLLVGLLDAAPDAVVCMASDGRIVMVNAQTMRLFGYTRQELIGSPVEILVPDCARAGHPALRGGYVADPRPRPMGAGKELSGRRRDGSTFPAEISLSAIDTGDGILVMAAVRDVTERRQAAEIAARLASIIQSSYDAVISETLDRVITSWNPAAERLYGYAAAEMIGSHMDVLIPAAQRGAEQDIQDTITSGQLVEPYQAERIREDGTVIEVSIMLSPITDTTGKVIGVSRISRDVSSQQRADARFRALLEAAPDAVVCVTGDGFIVMVNAQTERLFGYTRQELAGRPVEILVPDAARAGHPALRSRYVADPQPRPMGAGKELSGRRYDGSTFPAEISLSAIDTDDGILVMAAVRDITERLQLQSERERLRAEHERLQSQRLESLGQLAGGVAHDFNNLLAVISNYAAFAREEALAQAPQGPWESVSGDIQQIELAAERAAALTRRLLAFARREVINPRPLNLNDTVQDIEQLLIRMLGGHVELTTRLADDLCPVLADPGQIEQVLVNLAVNARDAMPGGGKLTIHTASTEVDEVYAANRVGLRPGRYATLKISDTGTGMSKATADRAFEPFFSTKPKGQGTGMGLATVYGIINQAGGHVRIYSEPGIGTTFTILLPATSQPAEQTSSQQPQGLQTGAGETVLVVEDEDALREVTRRILDRSGYHVLTAASGPEAIDIATEHRGGIDVLLTDVVMPHMPGKEAAARICVLRPATAVLYMSGYTGGVLDTGGVLEAGVNLIEKPFMAATLLARLREVITASQEPCQPAPLPRPRGSRPSRAGQG